jgi:hypothetical protein
MGLAILPSKNVISHKATCASLEGCVRIGLGVKPNHFGTLRPAFFFLESTFIDQNNPKRQTAVSAPPSITACSTRNLSNGTGGIGISNQDG